MFSAQVSTYVQSLFHLAYENESTSIPWLFRRRNTEQHGKILLTHLSQCDLIEDDEEELNEQAIDDVD